MRANDRGLRSLRPVRITPGYSKHAEGSALIEFGDTRVICTASVEDRVPPHLMGTGKGWVTAEYGMLPRATTTRSPREAAKGSITGGYVALALALRKNAKAPPSHPVAAISVGLLNGEARLDLDYAEDSTAGVDFNVVADAEGQLIEVQGTAEHATFSRAQLGELVDLGLEGIATLVKLQREALK